MNRLTATIILVLALALAGTLSAQTGSVVYFTSTAGTTKAANCPTTPTGPSMCLVGDGFWVWQNATTGWFLPAPQGASATPALTLNGVTKNLPASFTIAAAAPTVSAPTASAPAVTAQ
jgi:hypothetical protein